MDKREAMAAVERMDLAQRLANLSETGMTHVKLLIEQAVTEEQSGENGRKSHKSTTPPVIYK